MPKPASSTSSFSSSPEAHLPGRPRSLSSRDLVAVWVRSSRSVSFHYTSRERGSLCTAIRLSSSTPRRHPAPFSAPAVWPVHYFTVQIRSKAAGMAAYVYLGLQLVQTVIPPKENPTAFTEGTTGKIQP